MNEENRELNVNFTPLGKNFKPVIGGLMILLLASVITFMIFAIQNEYRQGRYIGQDVERKNSISVSGEGKIQAKPDIGLINLGVISEAPNVATAQKDNTEKMNKITQAMKDLGVEEKDLKTTNYNIYPKYQYTTSGRSNIIGYEVNQTLEVKIRENLMSKIGDILSKAAELGANQIGSLSFTFDDPEALKTQARKKAIENAKEKAKVLTDDLGVKIVRIINFIETASQPPTLYDYALKEGLGMGGGGTTPDIQTGENEIAAYITIEYEIQ